MHRGDGQRGRGSLERTVNTMLTSLETFLQHVLSALRSRTVPPAVAGSHTEACSYCQ